MDLNRSNKNSGHKSVGRRWPAWYPQLKAYRAPSAAKAARQLISTLVPYACLWILMVRLLGQNASYFFILLLSIPAGALLVRIFILFHDCVHGSFFKSRRSNTIAGYFLGVLVFTSFEDWRFCHLKHHANYGNLDTRGFGDIWTITRNEYENSSKWKRRFYRLYRNPVVLIGCGALFNFLLHNRLPSRKVNHKERMGVLLTNLLIVAVFLVAHQVMGWQTYLLIQLPVLWVAGAAGIWLFYVQHQFEGGYWAKKEHWEPFRAAMEGSSCYKLPSVLRWFSGNIGYHHIHHLSPGIPNYRLKACYDNIPGLQQKDPLTLGKSLGCIRMKLWDEAKEKMVGFPLPDASPH